MTSNIYKIGITALMVLLLNACGGGDSTPITTNDGNKTVPNPGAENPVPPEREVKLCSKGFSSLKKGNTIMSLTNDTKLNIRHKQDGNREVCVKTGEAKIK